MMQEPTGDDAEPFIIVASPSRSMTGTTRMALQIALGGGARVYHGIEYVLHKPGDLTKLGAIIRKRMEAEESGKFTEEELLQVVSRDEWDTVLHGYRGCSDNPFFAMFRELMQAYPNHKVILSVRPAEEWATSYIRVIVTLCRRLEWPQCLLSRLFRWLGWMPNTDAVRRMVIQPGLFIRDKTVDFTDEAQMARVYEQWLAHVQKHVPPEKLLIYRPDVDGWDKLCQFINRPVPQAPFPHVNKRDDIIKTLTAVVVHRKRTMLILYATEVALWAIGIAAIVKWFR